MHLFSPAISIDGTGLPLPSISFPVIRQKNPTKMKQFTPLATLASLIPLVYGHGFVTSPTARMPGSAMKAACGDQVEINQESDNYGNIQGELQVANGQSDYNAAKCDIWLCKGYKFADNKDNVYSYSAGQTVDFTVDIRAPHTGVANVSVVDTASNSVIGSPLIYWSVYASTATGVTKNETNFSVTIPDDLGDRCSTAGDCVLQWYWYAQSIDQTYESCVDFTAGGSDSSSSSSSSGSSLSQNVQVSSSTAVPVSSSSEVAPATPDSSAPAETSSPAAALSATTTFATKARQSSAPSAQPEVASSAVATPSAAASSEPFPTNVSSQRALNWVSSVFKYLVSS